MAILNKTDKEYLQSLIPDEVPDWRESWKWGYEEGKKIKIMDTPFKKHYGVKSDSEYRLKQAAQGKISWKLNTGLATVEDQANLIKLLEEFNERTGLRVSFAHQLPKTIVGTPKDKREGIPTALGFDLDKLEDWTTITQAGTVEAVFGDDHLGYPNSVFMTKNCLESGCDYQGLFCMFQQVAPGCPDEVWNMNEVIKGIGMVAAKYDENKIVSSNMDDGLPAYFQDLASYLGYAKWEYRLVHDLCKARYCFDFGNLTSNLIHKGAMILAASDTFKTEDQPGIEFIHSNTVDHWEHDLTANYGFQVPEALFLNLLERKYKTGMAYTAVPINEKVAIPSPQDLVEISGAVQRTDLPADFFEPLMNWGPVEELRDEIKRQSDIFYQNILDGFTEAGIDIDDPITQMVVIKKMNPTRFEGMFHPSVVQGGNPRIVPLMKTGLTEESDKQIDMIIEHLKGTPLADSVKGKDVCVVSGDLHYYGSYVVCRVLEYFGANVIDGGNSLDPVDILDIADEHDITDVLVSLHNGQALGYAKVLKELAAERDKDYRFFFGGRITSFRNEDDAEPSDVTEDVEALGIIVTTTVEDLMSKL